MGFNLGAFFSHLPPILDMMQLVMIYLSWKSFTINSKLTIIQLEPTATARSKCSGMLL